jgi:hypothetical protein
MKTWVHRFAMAAVMGGLAAGCSNTDMSTGPGAAPPAFSKGGGGTATPTPTPTSSTPTIAITSNPLMTNANPLVGQAASVMVIATSESGNRKAPTLTVAAAPAGFTQVSSSSVDGPHGGGPGYVIAQYTWTPTHDQIGLAATISFAATTSGGATTASATFNTVLDAPTALTGLTAVAVGDHIEAHWDASANGVAPISYAIVECYRNANIRESATTCDAITTTTATDALDLPRVNPTPTVAPEGGIATYAFVLVTPVDAAGHAGPTGTATVQ